MLHGMVENINKFFYVRKDRYFLQGGGGCWEFGRDGKIGANSG
jgi:hypothetical protein